jgi:hypothetical protein
MTTGEEAKVILTDLGEALPETLVGELQVKLTALPPWVAPLA